MDFIDSDLIIQRRQGRKLYEIMRDEGTDRFLKIEEEVLCSLFFSHTVLATGGSAVYSERAMAHLHRNGQCVYLRISFDEWRRRLGNIRHRGVVLRDGCTLEELYAERTVLYERYADLVFDMDHEGIEETVGRLIHAVEEGARPK